MVGIVKNTVSPVNPRKADGPDRASQEVTKASAAVAANASDSVKLKSADVSSLVKQMASSAPIDDVNVNRIKRSHQAW